MSGFNRTQHGATLAIALMLLFIITLIGVSSLRTTQMQEKMSHNVQDKVVSFQAAESGLIGAENLVGSIPTEPIPVDISACPNVNVNSTDICIVDFDASFLPEQQADSWWTTNGTNYNMDYPADTQTKNMAHTSPIFYIEFLKFVPDSLVIGKAPPSGIHYYRIFTYGTGSTTSGRTLLESTYNRRY